jgi:hypothetical protein
MKAGSLGQASAPMLGCQWGSGDERYVNITIADKPTECWQRARAPCGSGAALARVRSASWPTLVPRSHRVARRPPGGMIFHDRHMAVCWGKKTRACARGIRLSSKNGQCSPKEAHLQRNRRNPDFAFAGTSNKTTIRKAEKWNQIPSLPTLCLAKVAENECNVPLLQYTLTLIIVAPSEGLTRGATEPSKIGETRSGNGQHGKPRGSRRSTDPRAHRSSIHLYNSHPQPNTAVSRSARRRC